MNEQDYGLILDSLSAMGIYVIREDNHKILYCNKVVRDMVPEAAVGRVCHEVWKGSCKMCPLIGMGNKKTNKSFNFDGPSGTAIDISAVRIMWSGEIPAFIISFMPHAETYNSTYEKIVKGNLTTNSCEAIKMTQAERELLPDDVFTLTMALESFSTGGFLYKDDVERFREFSDIMRMSGELKSGKKILVCNYRRNTPNGVRWNTMEVIPDEDYTDDNQSVMIYVKDVHDIYRYGLGYEALSIKNEAILKSISGDNFAIYFVELPSGTTEYVRILKDDERILYKGDNWDSVVEKLARYRYHPDYRKKFAETFSLEALKKAEKEGGRKRDLLLKRDIGGEWHYISADAYFNKGTGDKRYVVVAFRDINERIKKELEYAENEKRLAAVIRSGYSVVNFLNLKTGICERTYLNENERTITGKYDDYIKSATEKIVYKEDRKRFYDMLSLDSLRRRAESAGNGEEEILSYRIKRDSEIRWLEEHIFYIHTGDGTEVDILGRDITERKRREEEESRSAKEKAYIISSLSSMFFSTGYIDLKNGTMRRIIQRENVAEILKGRRGYDEVLEEYAKNFIHSDDREYYISTVGYENISKSLSSGHSIIACEYREKPDENGAQRWVRANVVLAEVKDSVPLTALYVAQDITESKEREIKDRIVLQDALNTANLANASKSEFLSRMSHDIRTPMNAIIGMTAIAGTHIDDRDRVADCLGKITVSGKHLLSLINEILDLSKIESGRVELSEEEFELSEFFDELMAMILPSVNSKKQSLEFRLYDVHHEKVISDMLRLRQVFMNILSNAVKYTPDGGKIEIEVHERTLGLSGYGHYEFVFRDNGIGMSEEYVSHLFEPFTRDDENNSEGVEGTGLGMAIARNIVQMMNGDISVKTKKGEGSEFTVSLILKLSSDDGWSVKELIDFPVLVADDDRDSCEAACQILDEIGMKGEWVLSGTEAVAKTKEAHERNSDYFAVILDWKMPGMDGIETARRIRREVGPDVPIIILSAYDWERVEAQAREAGVNGFISKPLFKSRLVYLFKQFTGSANAAEKTARDLEEIENSDYSKKRILLVEDNELNREIAVEIIGMTGARIECAQNGKEAVEMFENNPQNYYDLIFMDIQMPVMNGHEATERIRAEKRADAKTIPIVAMSANAFTSDILASRNAGMNEHIIKPLDFESLTKCMDKWLKKQV